MNSVLTSLNRLVFRDKVKRSREAPRNERRLATARRCAKGHRLAYADQSWNENIWRIPIGAGHHGGKPELIYSTLQEEGPQYSPDGKHIVFQSTRSGSFEIAL